MKRKIIALLAGAALLCGITGCENTEGNVSAPESSTNSENSTPDSSTENSTDNSSEPSDSKVEFNFDEAVKNFTLFGNKISLPCTISDFGNDFSLNTDAYVPVGDTGNALFGLFYKNKEVGTVIVKDCREGEKVDNKEIVVIHLGFFGTTYVYPYTETEILVLERMNYYTGKIIHDFAGLSYDSTEAEAEAILGKPSSTFDWSEGYELTYEFENGYINIIFDYKEHKILQFEINVL